MKVKAFSHVRLLDCQKSKEWEYWTLSNTYLLHYWQDSKLSRLVLKIIGRLCVLSHVQLCDPMDCSPPGSSVHGISQARILEWMAISFSRGSSRPRDGTHVFWQDYLPLSHQGSYVIRNGRERYKFKICPMMCYTQLTIQFLQIGFNGWPKIRGDDV